MIERNFICNKTAEAFLKDNINQVQLHIGPVGAGKSSACMMKLYLLAINMPKGHDGIRRSKFAIVRNTYSQLKTTSVRTWQEWFPPTIFGDVKGDSPMTHHLKFNDVDCEVIFLALENEKDVLRLKSLELTAAYMNEAQFFYTPTVVQDVLERTDRYPGNILGGALKRKLVIMDCNPPTTNHWIYRKFEVERPDSWVIYKLPPALIKNSLGEWENNPEADYIKQVANPNYWLDMTKGATEEYIRVSLCGEYGIVEEGRAVHPEYNDRLHVSPRKIAADSNVQIGLGWDFGNTPACVVVQYTPTPQLMVLKEFWTEYMSVRAFAEDIVIPQLDKHFPFWRNNYVSRHDPSGQSMNADGGTCQSILRELGVISLPAESNAAQFRRDSLKFFLNHLSAGQPGFILSNEIQLIREGLMGKFKYELIKSTYLSDNKQYQEKPLKNIYSHSCEALEYIASEYARVSKKSTLPSNKATISHVVSQGMKQTTARTNLWGNVI